MRRVKQAGGMAALVLAGVLSVPKAATAQTVVPFAVPAGTNTGGVALPSSFNVPLSGVGTVNPLGLTPGFYSINLGQCMGALAGDCRGSFLTHAAFASATGGLPVDPETALASAFSSVLGNGSSAGPPTTMPGWTAFAMTFPQTQTIAVPPGPFGQPPGTPSIPWTQQALSLAKQPSIEMPLAPLGDTEGLASMFGGDPRRHFFGRSESYDRLSVGWTNWPFMTPRPEQHVATLSLSKVTLDFGLGSPSDAILWETFTADWTDLDNLGFPAMHWRIGAAAVTPGDIEFAFGPPAELDQANGMRQMLTRIRTHLATDEPSAARQWWLGINPLGMVAHDDWRKIANAIEAELPDLATGKESNLLTPDGALALRVRPDMDQFLLPEPAVVPEPSTLALLGIGIAGLALSRRRRVLPVTSD